MADLPQNLACPFCDVRIFQREDQLYSHVNLEHPSKVQEAGLNPQGGTALFRKTLREEELRKAKSSADRPAREASHASSDATGSTPDLTRLTLGGKKSSSGNGRAPSTYRPSRKRAAGSGAQRTEFAVRTPIHRGGPKRAKVVGYEIAGEPYTGNSSSDGWSVQGNSRCRSTRRRQSGTHRSPSYYESPKHSLAGGLPSPFNIQPTLQQQPGVVKIQRFDPRYPNFLL
ncbi:hypothetical protein V2W45_1000262 [Cenococcum geophilum]